MRRTKKTNSSDGEFLWLISLSDLMILLFVFFVVMFSFSYQRLSTNDQEAIANEFSDKKDQRKTLDEVQAQLLKWVVDKKLLENIEIVQKQDSLIIQIKEGILFKSGEALVTQEGDSWLSAVGNILTTIPAPYRIGIEGYTDDTPVRGSMVDNWQLSTLRALSVLRALHISSEQQERLVLMGYGQMKPLKPNRDKDGKPIPENQKLNRRVAIRIF